MKKSINGFKIKFLGQSSFFLEIKNKRILIDPYFSNSLEKNFGKKFGRINKKVSFEKYLKKIDYLFISHHHQDHCDLETIGKILYHSKEVKIITNLNSKNKLEKKFKNIDIFYPKKKSFIIDKGIKIFIVPAAHPHYTFDKYKMPRDFGFYFLFKNRTFYHSGDTKFDLRILNYLKKLPKIKTAAIPVNEDNYFKREIGIIGNMSIRECFEFAKKLKIKYLYPIHWDLIKINSVSKNEILDVYKKNFKNNFLLKFQ